MQVLQHFSKFNMMLMPVRGCP